MIPNRQEPKVSVPVDLLQEVKSILIGASDDIRCNTKTPSGNIEYGLSLIRTALNSSRLSDNAFTVAGE